MGDLLRLFLRGIPDTTQVCILSGTLRGKKWIKGSGVNGYWLGTYEKPKQKVFEKIVKQGDVVFDLGAQAGFYTLLASTLAGEKGRIFSFEPVPKNIFFIRKHLELNKIKNVTVIEAAVSSKTSSRFQDTISGFPEFNWGELFKARSVSLDTLLEEKKILPPDLIKMDIEGAEEFALEGAVSILKKYKPIILLATHSKNVKENCIRLLREVGYTFEAITEDLESTDEILARPNKI